MYEGYRDAILSRQLEPGQRLPSTRFLASELNVSRVSVIGAFDQLIAEGYLETRIGAGTFVAECLPQEVTTPGKRKVGRNVELLADSYAQSRLAQTTLGRWSSCSWESHFRAFRAGLPALKRFPVRLWSELLTRQLRSSDPALLAYGSPLGFLPLREAVADYLHLARAVRCDADQIMIVNGSQHGLQIAARVLINPGESVWLEEPGYLGARMAFQLAGANLVPVPVDQQGLVVTEGIKLSPQGRRRLYNARSSVPFQEVTLSPQRRIELLKWAHGTGAWIIEDDYDSEYRYSSRPLASLQGLDKDSRIILVGTFSKVMFPALRLGYMVLPKDLVGLFAAAREAMDWSSPLLFQAAMTQFIVEGHFARHIRKMLLLYESLRDTLVDCMQADGAEEFSVLSADAGMHLVVLLNELVSDVDVSNAAAALGVSAVPLSKCFLKKPGRSGLILGYGNVETPEIRPAILKLIQAVHAARI